MLSKADNERLTRVGPGTEMGELFRQYWQPVLFSWEVEADGPPERVRLLGEDLIAFRDSQGQVGMIEAHCPHRGAGLFFGRNEESGLRCVYHGWKFDTEGACVDMPSEPAESNFKHKVRTTAYPCVERGGVVWVYMGPLRPVPPLPLLEFNLVPDSNRAMAKRVQETNWAQALEGDIDQSHVSFLHSRLNYETDDSPRGRIARIRGRDRHPRFEVLDTDYGVLIGATRNAEEDTQYTRISQWLFPNYTMTGPYGPNPTLNWRAWVPIDDENVFVIGCNFHPLRPLNETELERARTGAGVWSISEGRRAPVTSQPFGRWRAADSLENDLGIDRKVQKTETYSGIPEFWAQDGGTQMTMGRIYNRTREHLGTSDTAIIAMRHRILRAAKALREEGVTPPGVLNPEVYQVRPAAVELPRHVSWIDASQEHRKVHADRNYDAV
jgi:phthalate 4,5-dioxygenase